MAQVNEVVSLGWKVKQSLLNYVEQSGGSINITHPAIWQSEKIIYPRAADSIRGSARLEFRGSVRLYAHDGLMDVLLADPALEFDGSVHTLTVRIDDEGERETIAKLDPVDPPTNGWASKYEASLLFAGSRLLGDVYDVNTRLHPVTLYTNA